MQLYHIINAKGHLNGSFIPHDRAQRVIAELQRDYPAEGYRLVTAEKFAGHEED